MCLASYSLLIIFQGISLDARGRLTVEAQKKLAEVTAFCISCDLVLCNRQPLFDSSFIRDFSSGESWMVLRQVATLKTSLQLQGYHWITTPKKRWYSSKNPRKGSH